MSSASSDILPSLNAVNEKNVLWVDTHYFNLAPHTIANMDYNAIWNSEKIRPKYLDIVLEFQFIRINRTDFKLNCIRTPSCTTNSHILLGNYRLEFHCSLNILDRDPAVLVLESNNYMIFYKYDFSPYYCRCVTAKNSKTALELKVLVKMIEYDCELQSAAYIHQEQEFRKTKEKFFNSEIVLNEMCYIFNIDSIQDIFTGRQNDEFAALKTTYIKRTSTFSREIANYMEAKDLGSPVPLTDLGLILNYILNEEQTEISDKDLFEVNFEARRMGLSFLVDLSRDAIIGRLGNPDFMIEALQVAECVGDKFLFEKVIETIHSCETGILNPTFLGELKDSSIQWRFMQSLERRLKKKESESHVETGESWQPTTSNRNDKWCRYCK